MDPNNTYMYRAIEQLHPKKIDPSSASHIEREMDFNW
jgi:hypothetical protein